MKKTIPFRIPSRLDYSFEQLTELPLDVVAKCVEVGAEHLVSNDTAEFNEIGDGTLVELKYDPRFGKLEEHLSTLTTRTGRPIQELLPSIFASGFTAKEPTYVDMLAKRTASKATAVNPNLTKGDGSTELN
ncbi:hypothetical protein WME88_26520 [Sorangium sp. So ce216]